MRSYLQHKPRHNRCIRRGWIIGLLILSVSARATAPVMSQDFLEYVADFDDENGEILDPLEYDQVSRFRGDAVGDVTEESINDHSEQKKKQKCVNA